MSASADSELSRRDRGRAHASRVDEATEEHATHLMADKPWVRPSSLDAPPPRKGYVQRWIRVTFRGADDPRNRNRKAREGWLARPLDTIPEEWFAMAGGDARPKNGAFVVDDLMLCEMPESKFNQRAAYYRSMAERQMEAVEHELENSQVPGHRIIRQHTSRVTMPSRTIGRKVEAASDED